jgi:hypothetical protein
MNRIAIVWMLLTKKDLVVYDNFVGLRKIRRDGKINFSGRAGHAGDLESR